MVILATIRIPKGVVHSSETLFILLKAAPTPDSASRTTDHVATVRKTGSARMVPGSLRIAWNRITSSPPTHTDIDTAWTTSEVMATPWDPNEEAWPVRAGSAMPIRAAAPQAAAAVRLEVNIAPRAMAAAIRLTMKNARTESTDQKYVLMMSGVRVLDIGRPSAQASAHSEVARLLTAQTSDTHPARTTSARPTCERTPLRPCGPSTAAYISSPMTSTPAAVATILAIGRPHATTAPAGSISSAVTSVAPPPITRPTSSPPSSGDQDRTHPSGGPLAGTCAVRALWLSRC